ncbi:hypothetical protein GCM10011396_51660 [Undibacterium terreum]|uniref:Uncharacterized protein n=1 Tax=Undibacterium terreum TaxID=1224302 RepID=A0A916V1X7_9BURK|nr:hypothetical protein GCM10011396_51660 [Undibacterium terreum]
MREIDDAHDAENQRQAACHQEKQEPVLNGVQALDEKCRKFHGYPALLFDVKILCKHFEVKI